MNDKSARANMEESAHQNSVTAARKDKKDSFALILLH